MSRFSIDGGFPAGPLKLKPNPTASAPVELIERLRRKKTQHRMNRLFDGLVQTATDETREVLVNPDGPEAADMLERLTAQPSGELIEPGTAKERAVFLLNWLEKGGWATNENTRAAIRTVALAAMSEGVDRYE